MPVPTTLRVYNTLKQNKQPLQPLVPGKVGIYVCGPTVYSFVHIGNARTFTSFDVIVRYLRYRGFEVRYVRNYTDVDDKIINAARVVGEWADDSGRHLAVDAEGTATLDGKPYLWTTSATVLTLLESGEKRFEVAIDAGNGVLTLEGTSLQRRSKEIEAVAHSARFVREFQQD